MKHPSDPNLTGHPPLTVDEEEDIAYLTGELDVLPSQPARQHRVGVWKELLSAMGEQTKLTPPGLEKTEALKVPLPKTPLSTVLGDTESRSGWRFNPYAFRWWPAIAVPAFALLALVLMMSDIIFQERKNAEIAKLNGTKTPIETLRLREIAEESWLEFNSAGDSLELETACAMAWGDSIRAIISKKSAIQITAAKQLQLEKGSAWFWVERGRGGLDVKTPYGEVHVLGTSFGIAISENETRVEVLEGKVAVTVLVSGVASQIELGAEKTVLVSANGIGVAEKREDGGQLPLWVRSALAQGGSAGMGALLPSLTTENN